MPNDMLNEMLLAEAPLPEEGDSPSEPADEDAVIALTDFDNVGLPPEARLDALKLLVQLVS